LLSKELKFHVFYYSWACNTADTYYNERIKATSNKDFTMRPESTDGFNRDNPTPDDLSEWCDYLDSVEPIDWNAHIEAVEDEENAEEHREFINHFFGE
jgi:hypothetical protein